MRYSYVKKKPKKPPVWISRFLPVILLSAGLFLVLSALAPIGYYQFFYSPAFSELASPVSEDYLTANVQEKVLGQTSGLDMTRASSWFPTAPRPIPRPSKITHYNLSIPKLRIQSAIVEIGGEDLKKSLIQYPGTALPGQLGNTVVFGHSTLPQFFSPTNYTSIFSTLPTLKKNDEVLVDFDGVNYRYVIEEMFEVKPTDISVLEQRFDDSYLSLITCVPPGTYLRRLVIRARLTPL